MADQVKHKPLSEADKLIKAQAKLLYVMNIPLRAISRLVHKDKTIIYQYKKQDGDWDEAKKEYQDHLLNEMTKGFINTKLKMLSQTQSIVEMLLEGIDIEKVSDVSKLRMHLEYMKFLYSLTGGADTIVNVNSNTEDPQQFFNKFWGIKKESKDHTKDPH